MRRKDKQINDSAMIEDILSRALVCRLALCDTGRPYVVPLCFGVKDNTLYFHCSAEGKKLDMIKKNNNVCFEIDIDQELIKSDKPCGWGLKYKSIIGFGKAVLIEDIDQKQKALDIIMRQYSEGDFEYPAENIKRTTVIKIEIASMTAKQSGY